MSSKKRLYRSQTDRHVAGVCGGLAEYFNIDPTLVRLIFVVLTILSGPGLILYIVLWIVMPDGPTEDEFEYLDEDDLPKVKRSERTGYDEF